jgi:hypothetical protein
MNYAAWPAVVLAVSSYVATTFIATRTGASPQDVLAAGGQMNIVLHWNGSTSGTLEVPASITNPEPAINASMAGSWVQTGNTIRFQQQADTFVRDVTWVIGSGTLTGSFSEPEGTVEVTLTIIRPD